ncbi:MAG: transporter substrate-binding domain-containing protein [Deltaproteobacteria bacterium]|nr:transporter substrate-binding domain-containing protein [Deltaproteobacteria bacterium]
MVLIVSAAGTVWSAESLRIANEGAYPPFNSITADGKLVGFDVEIAKALCEKMGVEPEFVIQDWNGIITGLLAKKYECIISSMSITDERKKRVAFTDPYYQVPARFVTLKGSGVEISREGLEGKRIGVQRATTYANYLEGEFKGIVEIVYYDTIDDHNMDLANGRLDAVLGQAYLMGKWMEKPEAEDFVIVGDPVTDPKYIGYGAGIAVRKEDEALRKRLDQALDEIIADGTHKRIADKYFDFDLLDYSQ